MFAPIYLYIIYAFVSIKDNGKLFYVKFKVIPGYLCTISMIRARYGNVIATHRIFKTPKHN